MLTFLISIFGCFLVSLSTIPRVRFLCLLFATVWALVKYSWENLGLVFLHIFSRLAVPVLYISDAFVMCWNLHLHHDHLSETYKCLGARTDLMEFSDNWPVLLSPSPFIWRNSGWGKSTYWEYGVGTVGLNTSRFIQNRWGLTTGW